MTTTDRPGRQTASRSGPAGGTDVLATAERILAVVRDRSADAEAEVTVRRGTEALTRFANGFIHQNVAEEVATIRLRIALDGHVASASLGGAAASADGAADRTVLERLVDGAIEAARVRPPDPGWPGLTPPTPVPAVDHWDDATAAATPDERAERVAAFVAAGDGLETAGYCSTSAVHVGFANSAGQTCTGRSTVAEMHGIARTGTSDGSARDGGVALAAIDGGAIGALAARKARDGAEPTDLEPGRYPVVLEPDAVADILHFLGIYGFNGRAVEEGRSFVRLGERQLDPSIEIREDASDPGTVGLGFDVEGTPKRPVELVRSGVTSAILHDRRTAAKAGATSTGGALPGAESIGPLPTNLVLEAGRMPAADLVAGLERGLLVTSFWYTRILDPRTLVVTGLTRNGVWLVEDGRVVRPVKNLRFTQSYVEALAPGAVAAISRERSLVPDAWDDGATLVPSLRLAAWNFTGGARG